MSNIEQIKSTILNHEKSINERWNNGSCQEFIDSYTENATYIDPRSDGVVCGAKNIEAHIRSMYRGVQVVKQEWHNVNIEVNDTEDMAILTYNLQNYAKDSKGNLLTIPLWNCTQVYRLINGEWKIAHNHWSFSQHAELIESVGRLLADVQCVMA